MATRTLAAVVAGTIMLAACTAPTQPFLDQARTDCTAGSQQACSVIPQLQAQVNAEHNDQAAKVATGFLAVLGAAAAGAAAGYAASHPAPVYVAPVVVCRGWGCW